MLILAMVIPNFLCPVLLPVCGVPEVKRKNKKLTNELWQCHCRNRGIKVFFSNCGNGIVENGGKKVTKSMKE